MARCPAEQDRFLVLAQRLAALSRDEVRQCTLSRPTWWRPRRRASSDAALAGPGGRESLALRAGLASGRLMRFPGAFNPLSRLLIERLGFEGVYVSGAVLSASLGLPDVGLTTLPRWPAAATRSPGPPLCQLWSTPIPDSASL